MDDIEISEVTVEDEEYANKPSKSFREEFEEKVSISTIMAGATSIGRNEARLMLCQLRGVSLQKVPIGDPGVLMLDGLPLNELGKFLDDAEQSGLADSLRGSTLDSSDDEQVTPNNPNNNNLNDPRIRSQSISGNNDEQKSNTRTLPELAEILTNFRTAQTVNQRSNWRKEFFSCFNNLDAVHRLQIPTDVRNVLESAQQLGASGQETLLMEVQLPDAAVQRMSMNGEDGGGAPNQGGYTPGMTTAGTTNTALYGEAGLMGATSGVYASTIAQKVAELESKNILQWIKNNRGSSHVWFFF